MVTPRKHDLPLQVSLRENQRAENLAYRIKKFRLDHRMDWREFQVVLGVSEAIVKRLEEERADRIARHTLATLAEGLGTTMQGLLDWLDNPVDRQPIDRVQLQALAYVIPLDLPMRRKLGHVVGDYLAEHRIAPKALGQGCGSCHNVVTNLRDGIQKRIGRDTFEKIATGMGMTSVELLRRIM